MIFVLIVSMYSDQDIGWFITTPKYLNEGDLLIAVEFTLRETSFTNLSFRELPKITKLHLEIFKVNRLLENQLEP